MVPALESWGGPTLWGLASSVSHPLELPMPKEFGLLFLACVHIIFWSPLFCQNVPNARFMEFAPACMARTEDSTWLYPSRSNPLGVLKDQEVT